MWLFKYISCSYLSKRKWDHGIKLIHSNTSHVLIYRTQYPGYSETCNNSNTSHVLIYLEQADTTEIFEQLFKYISCSYLSDRRRTAVTTGLEFKYISCSYLSLSGKFCQFGYDAIQIHLMFLFIISPLERFPKSVSIQIHLMFLFIFWFYKQANINFIFKYISCSYLSESAPEDWQDILSFKYISCSYLSQASFLSQR